MTDRVARVLCAVALGLSACATERPSNRAVHYPRRTPLDAERADRSLIDRVTSDQRPGDRVPIPLLATPSDTGPVGPRPELGLADVLASVDDRFPLILAAEEEIAAAQGALVGARGGFDTRLRAGGEVAAEGFYEYDRVSVSIEQPTAAWGATVFGGYRRGDGNLPSYFGDRETADGGEFMMGVRIPLLAGFAIDQRRVDLWKARIERDRAEPFVDAKRIEAAQKAAGLYWNWVAAGQKLAIAERLLRLAEDRQEGIREYVRTGELPEIAVDENQRLVVERRAILARSNRELEAAAIQLSLYLRDGNGAPRMPVREELPIGFPDPNDPAVLMRAADIERALELRPELRARSLDIDALALDIARAENTILPRFDVGVVGSSDVGDAVDDPDTKRQGELDAFFNFDLPLQRRAATGKARELRAKRRKLDIELGFAQDRVRAEVLDAMSALTQTWARLEQARENAELAEVLERAERELLEQGESDLLRVNLRERDTASAAAMLVDLLAEHFRALADYRAAIGVRP